MSKKKKLAVCFVLLLIVYLGFNVWIARDTALILRAGMKNDTSYAAWMSDEVYKKINPGERGMMQDYYYQPAIHHIRIPIGLHLFVVGKVWVKHSYDAKPGAFNNEPVTLTLKLKNGRWYATDVHIEP